MIKLLREFKSLWILDIIKRKKVTPFLIFFSFLVSFLLARLIVVFFPGFNVLGLGLVKTYHIHHYYWGIALVLIAGWVVLVSDSINLKRISAVLYGVGFGMLIDEIGLLLTCGTQGLACNYYSRITYDVVTYIVVGFLLIMYWGPFWRVFHNKILKNIKKIFFIFRSKKGL